MAVRSSLPTLLYHHVGPRRPGTYPTLTVDPSRFRRHIAWLARRGYRSLTIEDAVRWVGDRRPPATRSVLITFDDAYADLADWAFPMLREAGLSAVVFVPTGFVGQTNRWDADVGGAHALLTADQLRDWSREGIEFGAHGRTHAELSELGEREARWEMEGSKADLEAILDRPVTSFAYPYGECDDATARLAASIFDIAFTAVPGPNTADTEAHRLRRSMVSMRDLTAEVEARAILGFSPPERARARLSRMRRALRPGAAAGPGRRFRR